MPRWIVRAWRRVYASMARLPLIAVVLAFFGYVASDTPSLLPRPWFFQGLIAGLSAVIFFVLGAGLHLLWSTFVRWSGLRVTLRPEAKRVLTRIFLVAVGVGFLTYPFVHNEWHRLATAYVGQPDPPVLYPLLSALVAIVVIALFYGVWFLIVALTNWLTGHIHRQGLRVALARTIATLTVILLVGVSVDQFLVRGLLAAAHNQADQANKATPTGAVAPLSPMRSGGPGSLVSWDSLGADAKSFISDGPNAAQIASIGADGVKEPIRIFASIEPGRSLNQTRDLVLAEMDRTHAFERKAVLVLTATSTGFVNEWASESFEYLLHGDTAIVTMQYSTLPSALALLTAREQPPQVGRLLFNAVSTRVLALPSAQRPQLYAGGESLGGYGGNGAFGTPEEMMGRLDGALWTGTPSFTPLHGTLTGARSYGSTTVNPTIEGGRHVRFAANPAELTADQFGHAMGPWESPRIVYLQHDDDPVVWWSTDLILNAPPWLHETEAPGSPMSLMSWWPFVTFWQVSADMARSNTVPGGYGHRYFETETVPAWAGVLGMDPNGDYRAIEAAIKSATGG